MMGGIARSSRRWLWCARACLRGRWSFALASGIDTTRYGRPILHALMCARQCRPSPTQVTGGHNRAMNTTFIDTAGHRLHPASCACGGCGRGPAAGPTAAAAAPRSPRVTRQRAPEPATASLLLLRRRRRAAVMIARRGLSIAGVSAGKACMRRLVEGRRLGLSLSLFVVWDCLSDTA